MTIQIDTAPRFPGSIFSTSSYIILKPENEFFVYMGPNTSYPNWREYLFLKVKRK